MIEAIWKGILLGLMLSISVGPVIFSIIKQSINNGHKGGYYFISGVAASDVTLVVGCTMFTALFDSLRSHEKIIGIVGSIFLICMGLFNLFLKKVMLAAETNTTIKTFRKRELLGIFLSGFFMNILNPAVIIFWLVSATAFTTSNNSGLSNMLFIIIVFSVGIIFNTFADIAKVLLANKIRPRLTPHNIHIINRISGLILVVFGVVLMWGTIAKLH